MSTPRAILALALGVVAASAEPVVASQRAVAMILDTSGSMESNDAPRYTVQVTQIVSDLLDDGDELIVIGMPGFELTCSARASSSLAVRLNPSDRLGFKRRLDEHMAYNTGTHFAAPIRTAIQALSHHRDRSRMLLIVADSGGMGQCEGPLTRELENLHRDGGLIAAINLGSTAGAFDRNPAFDFTSPALNAHALVTAVGQVYQRFLGAKKIQTGRVSGTIEVEIAPHVREAFLVVAADGPMGELRSDPSNPGARHLDLDHRGGGRTRGLDGRTRGYRIARLERPAGGRWTFRAPGLGTTAGWLLVQDLSALGVRLVSPARFPKGLATTLVAELYDTETGEVIRDLSAFAGLEANLTIDGRQVRLKDDGNGHLSGEVTVTSSGARNLSGHLESQLLTQDFSLDVEILEAAWNLRVETLRHTPAGSPVKLSAALEPLGDASKLPRPDRIDAITSTETVALEDSGEGGDNDAGDGVYSGLWTPNKPGTVGITYRPVGSDLASEVQAPLEILGTLKLGTPAPVSLGPARSESVTEGSLDLSTAEILGSFQVNLSTEFRTSRAVLEIDPGSGWVRLGDRPVALTLSDGGPRRWPLRLRVGSCPEACAPTTPHHLVIESIAAEAPVHAEIPLRIEVIAAPWLACWWPLLAALAGLLTLSFVVYGFVSPSRFPPRLGVVLSPEEDLQEGFFHPIRSQRGSGSGFYRDARVYIRSDFRLSSRPGGGLARLRAEGNRIRLQPIPGVSLLRRTADDGWEPLPAEEATARFGQAYRNDAATLFFEIRNG